MTQTMDSRTVKTCRMRLLLLACAAAAPFASDVMAEVRPASCSADAAYAGPAPRDSLPADVFPEGELDRSKNMPDDVAEALGQQFDQSVDKVGATAVAVSIWQPELGHWSRQSGVPEDSEGRFWVASVGKMVTGTIVFQLIEEGKLSLEAPLDTWFPDYPGAALISVDELLTHTAGVFTFNADRKLAKRRGYKSPALLLKTAARHGLDFCPGTDWYYSNTGYLMLGLIAEAIEEKSLAEIVDERVTRPMGLSSFGVIGEMDPASSLVPTAGEPAASIPEIASIRGAGAIRSNTDDLLAFLHAYLSGKLISDSSRERAFSTLYPMFGEPMSYGRGVMVMDVPDTEAPTTWLGHVGGSPNAKSVLMYDLKRRAFIAISLNKQGPAEALANVLMKTLDDHLLPSPR